MTEVEELQRAVEQAEAEAAALAQEVEALTAQRRALSQQPLAALNARKTELVLSLRSLTAARAELEAEQRGLRGELERGSLGWSALIASPLTWFLRSAMFAVYVSSVVTANRWLDSPGLVFALVLGLPVAFALVMVAGSLRESGTAHQAGARPGTAEDPARQPSIDERAVAPPGGPGEARAADRTDREA